MKTIRSMRNKARGMTLIELMIVVVIVATLASVGIPSYRQYVIRSTRTEAKTALLRVQAAQEKFYLQNNRYAVGDAELTAGPPAGLGIAKKSEGGNYDISLPVSPQGAQGFLAQAVPANGSGQKQDNACPSLSIDHTGRREPLISAAAPCWR